MPAPPRVKDIQLYWISKPTELSDRCLWWKNRIENGWIGNKRINKMGYYELSEYFGVYIWEYINILAPLLNK